MNAPEDFSNVGQLLTYAASCWPDHPAVAEPDYANQSDGWKQATFAELEAASNRIANGLRANGVQPGQRIALLVPPGIDFVMHVFALFKANAVVILIDPGIGRKNLVRCMSEALPTGVVGIAKAQIARWVFRRKLPLAKKNFIVGRKSWPGCMSVQDFVDDQSDQIDYPKPGLDSEAAIIFTSGSTGPPKGVAYRHVNFITQAIEIRDYFDIQPMGADISGFPLFALFNTAMGMTTVFPKMDFTRPASVSPQLFVDAIKHWKAEQSFGSPALWNTVSRWCEENQQTLPTVKRVLSAGAPVPAHVMQRVRNVIAEDGEMFTPYGATEALPVACNSASIVLGETSQRTDQGAGVCVGSRFARINWKVIEITDEPIKRLVDAKELPVNEIGELIVSGPVVTRQYVTRTDANAYAKIDDNGTVWHRMGDTGYLDEHRRFWFCGRKSQRVLTELGTLFTVQCESILNTHPAIYRSALVGPDVNGSQMPVIIAEPWPEHWPRTKVRQERLKKELLSLAEKHEVTKPIKTVLLQKSLPVDIRHNSKIFREQLRIQTRKRLSKSGNG